MRAAGRHASMARGLNALIGAGATVVLAPAIPLSPLLGGAIAGYLSPDDGLAVGSLSGVIALLPLLVVFAVLGLFGLGIGLAAPVFAGVTFVVLGLVFVFLVGYVVVLSALGGLVGSLIRSEIG